MSAGSSIEWTDATWNPVRGCTRVSEGCRNCYAERFAARMAWGRPFARMTPAGPRWTGVVRLIPEMLSVPLRWREPKKVFVNSMSDLFHESLDYNYVAAVYGIMAAAPQHTFQVLTKRPERRLEFFDRLGPDPTFTLASAVSRQRVNYPRALDLSRAWPLPNVWEGVSVEDQATADERIPLLLRTSAAKRFVSYEPALGPVDFGRYYLTTLPGRESRDYPFPMLEEEYRTKWVDLLDWVIVGGESGPGARPFDAAWARSAVKQCKAAGVACFVKQMGSYVRDRNDRLATDRPAPYSDLWPEPECGWDDGARGNWEELDTGYQGAPIRIRLADSKGGDPQEWPRDLRVREFPA